MNINRENYEIYFIDYFDGKLNPAETAGLMLFLEQNPELREEFEDFENVSLTPEEVVFPAKEKLKKKDILPVAGIHAENYERFFIACHEGDLLETEKSQLREFLNLNPSLQKDFEAYGKVFLKPDENILYPGKKSLKKYPFAFRKLIYYASSAAALILMLIGFYFFFLRETPPETYVKSPKIVKLEKNPTFHLQQSNRENDLRAEINPRTEITEISNPVIISEKADIFTMQAGLINEPVENKSIDGLIPRILYQRFENNLQPAGFEQFYAEDRKEKSLLGKVIGNAFNSIASVFESNVEELELDRVSKINFWDIAEAGISGYNTLADRDVIMVRQLDKHGNLKSVALLGDNINYQKSFAK